MTDEIDIKLPMPISFILIYAALVLPLFQAFGSSRFYMTEISGDAGPMAQYYYFLASFVLLGIIPTLIMTVWKKTGAADLGMTIGNRKNGLITIALGLPLMLLIAFFTSKDPSFQNEYPLYRGLLSHRGVLPGYIVMYAFYYIGWEAFFRGIMLFGLRRSVGDLNSILLQTIPSCLLHIGKPQAEFFGALVGGICFGWVALRCKSFWPIFICHLGLGIFVDVFIIYG